LGDGLNNGLVSIGYATITLFTLHCYRIRVGLGIP